MRKVPGGKLLKVSIEHEKGAIVKAKVTGDFFCHPEDAIERLEEMLAGTKRKELGTTVSSALKGAKLYGVDQESIVSVIEEAMK